MGLQVIEIVLALEEHFGVSIPDDAAAQCITVGDMQKEIARLLAVKRHCEPETLMPEVWKDMVDVIVDQMGMTPHDVTPNSTWVGDITKYG